MQPKGWHGPYCLCYLIPRSIINAYKKINAILRHMVAFALGINSHPPPQPI